MIRKIVVGIGLLVFTLSSFAQSISQWRGINRDGFYNETSLLKVWPEQGPTLLWNSELLGPGYGSPAIADGKVFVNGSTDSLSCLFAFDLQGKLLWKSTYGPEFYGNNYAANFSGARSTPTIFGDLVYVCSGKGVVACFEKESGKQKWMLDVIKDFNGIPNDFGFSESILVDKDKLYFYTGAVEANIVCLNRFTGANVWQSKAVGDSVSFCSPIIINLPSRSILVTFSTNDIFALDTKNGDLLWSQIQDTIKYGNQCNTPVFDNGYIYYLTSDGNGAVKLALSDDGASIKEVWRNRRAGNSMGGFVKIGDYIYSTNREKKLFALNTNTGLVENSIRIGGGSTIYSDSMLYCYIDNGDVCLIKVANSQMEVLSKFKVSLGTKEHFAHPVISNGVLYIRHGSALMAFKIK